MVFLLINFLDYCQARIEFLHDSALQVSAFSLKEKVRQKELPRFSFLINNKFLFCCTFSFKEKAL